MTHREKECDVIIEKGYIQSQLHLILFHKVRFLFRNQDLMLVFH